MYDNIKLALLGGDLRQLSIARRLSGLGFEAAVWGLGTCETEIGDAVRCAEWQDAIKGSRAVILPLPASADGINVNCPLNTDAGSQQLRMMQLLEEIERAEGDVLLIGGKFTPSHKSAAEKRGIRTVDYFDSEELQIKNAVPTAEGAIAIAMNELPVTIQGSKSAVIGYGRVGRVLADKLAALGSRVTVAARKPADLAWAYNRMFDTLRIELRNGKSSLAALGRGYDVIFNTVPYWLFDSGVLAQLCEKTLIIDIASAPGGVDSKAAGECGIKVIWALSLPGKNSPFTAGEIICDSIIDILAQEGVIQ
ncbi:MAG TPA: NAD(P)-binding domain-containing protein [Clostridiales bacterium]|nr:NAD(P)-binding domain-containing protein [Clostridiales bacterium]